MRLNVFKPSHTPAASVLSPYEIPGLSRLKPEGRKAFFRAYEQRMDTLVTHLLFNYRVNYRRALEIQTRLLARYLTGEIPRYTPFVTR